MLSKAVDFFFFACVCGIKGKTFQQWIQVKRSNKSLLIKFFNILKSNKAMQSAIRAHS